MHWKITFPAPSRIEPYSRKCTDQIIEMALERSEPSPKELAVTFTDTKGYFVSESSVYRLLKAHDLITSPAFVVICSQGVQGQNHTLQRDVADGFHAPEDYRLGLVLSVDHSG